MKELPSKILIGFLLLLSRLPLWCLYGISNFLYFTIYKLIKYRVKVVRSNIDNAFPDKNAEEKTQIEKKFYRYLTDLVMETVKGFTAGEKFLRKRMTYLNTEFLVDLYQRKQSAIVVMGHCGNWEWVCKSGPFFMDNRLVGVYKPLTNKPFDRLLTRTRTRFGVEQVPMAQIGKYILTQKEPFLLILIGDQSPSDTIGVHWTRFLNQETAVLTGAEKLALKFKIPLYFNDIKRTKRGYYTCTPKLLLDKYDGVKEGDLTELHTRALEEEIIKQPETWLWSHRRWKLKKPFQ